jgi:hypothetical protein
MKYMLRGEEISEEEAKDRGLLKVDGTLSAHGRERGLEIQDDEPEYEEEESSEVSGFGTAARSTEVVKVETGRGNVVDALVGAPFEATINRIADMANYGGYFKVFLNGSELVDPETAPSTIQAGMRIALTSYDKVGS